MTLPASGSISIGQVAAELGIGLPLTLGDSRVRTLAGVPSGPISMTSLYGKSAYTPMTLTTNGASSGPVSSDTVGGTVSGTASVGVTGGTGGYTYQWTLTSSSGSPTIGGTTSNSVTASKTFVKQSSGSATAVFNISVTDNTGHTVTATGVEIDLYWGTNV